MHLNLNLKHEANGNIPSLKVILGLKEVEHYGNTEDFLKACLEITQGLKQDLIAR